ncbi:unnamed protein product [Schistosoma curassoni]|uniref:Ovule protein n=1 Tax=Schistosoma curassoni TaxID=6186 RepID=A0A183L0V4_9TREM|nr:unnamed protein product [Schistosoma curassoni]
MKGFVNFTLSYMSTTRFDVPTNETYCSECFKTLNLGLNLGFVLFGTHQQGVPVILRELKLSEGFDLVSPSFTVRHVTTEL